MPKPSERRKKKKFIRITTKTKEKRIKDKTKGKHKCALCKKTLRGKPKNLKKKLNKNSKTGRTVSVLFGGLLCSKCRKKIIDNAIMVKTGIKKMEETNINERKYIKTIINRL